MVDAWGTEGVRGWRFNCRYGGKVNWKFVARAAVGQDLYVGISGQGTFPETVVIGIRKCAHDGCFVSLHMLQPDGIRSSVDASPTGCAPRGSRGSTPWWKTHDKLR